METSVLSKYHNWLSRVENINKLAEIEKWIDIHSNLIKYYPDKLIELVPYDNRKGKWGDTDVIFYNLGNDKNYYLKVIFCNNYEYEIWIMDNTKEWLQDKKLTANKEFMDNFIDNGNDVWTFKENKYNLIGNFDKLVNDVRYILKLINIIIDSNGMAE